MLHSAKHDGHLKKVRHVMKSGGYTTGKQNTSVRNTMKKVADKEVHKHEESMHPGKKLTKLKSGGCADGGKPHERLDKKARGGKTKGSHVHVNVIVPQGSKQPMAAPMGGGMAGAAARPPMPPQPPQGAMPPQGGGMPPRPMVKTGGKLIKEEYGAGSGEGRLEKTARQKKADKRKEGGYIRSKDGSINVGS